MLSPPLTRRLPRRRLPTSRADPRMRLVQVIDFWPGSGSGAAWCSFPCRHRAWELTRAAASGLAAVQVIDRVIQVDGPFTVNERVEVEFVLHRPAWLHALAQLTEQIDTGKVYDRDLPALAAPLRDVRSALNRRPVWHRQHPS